MDALHDMHCHLDFMSNAEEVAQRAARNGTLLFNNTVRPGDYAEVCNRFSTFDNVVVGFGAHPWWASEAEGIDNLLEAHDPTFIGEIGLDLSKRHTATRDTQAETFTYIAQWAARHGGKILSIHSVRAAREVLDVLEEAGTAETCTCIFHWYTGPSDQLKRAIDLGCYFSVGPRMLATKKGREYTKAIPLARLLLETDDPPHENEPYPYESLRANLEAAADGVAAIKGPESLAAISATSQRLLESQ